TADGRRKILHRSPGRRSRIDGQALQRSVKMYVYPTLDAESGEIRTADTAPIPPPWHHMRDLLIEIGRVEPIRDFNETYTSIHTTDVLARIQSVDVSWQGLVPSTVAEMIKAKKLFGFQPSAGS